MPRLCGNCAGRPSFQAKDWFRPLFRAVPRERFVPEQIWADEGPVDRASEPERWLASVYSDRPLVTQYDDGDTTWPTVGERPTCSSSMPSAMVGMLDALDVREGQTVLEIGTGTGFNAALLAQIVGERGAIHTVELDPALHAEASKRLTGYRQVSCLLGDGTTGIDAADGFDRVICTASVHLGRMPHAWVASTRPAGLLVTPVRADLASGPLVRCTVHEDGTATGRTLPMGVGFMEVRSQRTAQTSSEPIDWAQDGTSENITSLEPRGLFDDPAIRWALAVGLPSCRYGIESRTDGHELVWLRDPLTDAWASVLPDNAGRYLVRQSGIRRLWDEAEAAYRWWERQARPATTDWEWIIMANHQAIRPIR